MALDIANALGELMLSLDLKDLIETKLAKWICFNYGRLTIWLSENNHSYQHRDDVSSYVLTYWW
jgi:hypothetical protein